jgi:DtxR family Mn-dependent transcriptional regulator
MPEASMPMKITEALSLTEEDYLKAIYHLEQDQIFKNEQQGVSTNDIARKIDLSAASVSDMIKKLAQKSLLHYVKYQGVTLTDEGRRHAIYLIRKHRLWETFLVEKLRFAWDEVHEIAEQLEHIHSVALVARLDEFLGYPRFDPHGDPIPNEAGEIVEQHARTSLRQAPIGQALQVVAVRENSPEFLQYLNRLGINLDTRLEVLEYVAYDLSLRVSIEQSAAQTLTHEVAENIFITPIA